ncbi:MAG: SDR family NAD(P)-dependent oxidoreductase [Planctomycetota bacterium]|nr:SDR family NAD(P)-dependent oxidoreductase [Planctomycetota bacterium]
MPRNLTGQVIAITGASSGIGAATALECARAGMDVALAARRVDKLEKVAAEIRAMGRRAICVACDVTRDDDVQRFVDATVAQLGRLDAAFANAGYGINRPVMETTDAHFRAIFETNVYGTLRVIRAAVPVMRKAGRGHLLICSSAASEIAPPGYGAYAATKASQDCIGQALRAELRDENIFVTTVHPIGTTTEFLDRVADDLGRPIAGNTPGAFTQTVETVARAIVRSMRQDRPKPEVWPQPAARFVLGLATAFPGLTARGLLRSFRARPKETTS